MVDFHLRSSIHEFHGEEAGGLIRGNRELHTRIVKYCVVRL